MATGVLIYTIMVFLTSLLLFKGYESMKYGEFRIHKYRIGDYLITDHGEVGEVSSIVVRYQPAIQWWGPTSHVHYKLDNGVWRDERNVSKLTQKEYWFFKNNPSKTLKK